MECIACGARLDTAANDPSFDRIPYRGTLFYSWGHYGSTCFDPMDGHKLELIVCDTCLRASARRGRVDIVSADGKTREPWNGHAQGIEAGTVETEGLDQNDESPVPNGDAPEPEGDQP